MNDDNSFSILPILKKIPLLEELNEVDHQEILKHITLEYFPKNHIIFHEQEAGDAVYIIKRGIVRIYHENVDPDEEEVSMLGDNDFFGEMAIISEKPRNASAKSMEDSEIFVLKKKDFMDLLSTNPNMASRISSEFLKRLKVNLKNQS